MRIPSTRTTSTSPIRRILFHNRCFNIAVATNWNFASAGHLITFEQVDDQLTDTVIDQTFYGDPLIGVRIALSDQRNWFPKTAVTLSTPVDFESSAEPLSRFARTASLGYSWLVSERFLVYRSSGIGFVSRDEDWESIYQQSAAVNWMMHRNWDLYVELLSLSDSEDVRLFAGPGISHRLTRNLQIGVNTSFGMNEASTDLQTQVNLTWRR